MVSDCTEMLTPVWITCPLDNCKSEGKILTAKYGTARRKCIITLNAVLLQKLMFRFSIQVTVIRNYLHVNRHHLAKITNLFDIVPLRTSQVF